MRADNASDSAGPRNDPAGGDAATADSDPVSDPAAGLLTTPQSPDELIAEYDEERPGRRLSARLDRRRRRAVLPDLGVRAVAGLRTAAARQPVLPDPVPGRGAAAGVHLLPRRPAARRRARRARRPRRPRLGCSPRWPCWSASTRCCRSRSATRGGGFDAFLDRQGSLTHGRHRHGRPAHAAGPGGLPPHHRAGAADHLPGVLPLRLLRRLPADPWPIGHAGFDFSQIINGFYNDQSGFYGIPLDVCATYIVLFTIYGAVLDAHRRRPVLHRPQLRGVPQVTRRHRGAPSRSPASCWARCPARARRPRSAWAR